jgi:hypothetical protein
MRKSMQICLTVFVLAALGGIASTASAQLQQLAAKVPADANSLVLLNIEKVMNSPAAVKNKWNTDHSKSYSAGITFLPPNSKAAVLAAQYDFEMMKPVWQVAAMELDHEASLPLVERVTGGTPDQIGSLGAVALPGDAYIVKFAPQVLAALAPANRQLVGRWVREAETAAGPRLSPYLMEAYGFANDLGTPLVLAMDLQDVATVDAIRAMLQESGKYKDAAAIEQRVLLLASIRGVTLGITLASDEPFGKIKVDFANDVTVPAAEAKAMLLHALGKRGAMLDELEDWTAKVAGKQVTLEGNLTRSGTRRIASLFDRPPAFKADAAATDTQVAADPSQPSAQASQEYYRRVVELFEDLRQKPKREGSGYTIGSIGVWCDNYARKIDKLPILGVDPELVGFGAYTAEGLRAAAEAIKMIGARKNVRQANAQPQYDYYTYGTTYGYSYRSGYGGAGYVPYGSSATVAVPNTTAYSKELARIATEERASGATDARGIFDQLEKAQSEIRRKMTMKYNVEF